MIKRTTWGLGIAFVLALVMVFPAFAEAVSVSGTITSIDEVGGTFTLTLADATVYVVTPPAGFDWTSIAVGDAVDVSGESDGAGNIAASSVSDTATTVSGVVQSIDYTTCTFTLLTAEGTTLTVDLADGTDCSGILLGANVEVTGTLNPDGTFSASGVVINPTPSEEGVNTGFYCSNPAVPHPALSSVAAAHGYDYGAALNLFCGGGLGVGGVDKLLGLSADTGKSVDELLAMRKTMGWGKLKKTLAAETTEVAPLTTDSSEDGNGNGNGGGPPPWAGGGNGNGGGNGHGKGKNK
jgi:hypothetical protein